MAYDTGIQACEEARTEFIVKVEPVSEPYYTLSERVALLPCKRLGLFSDRAVDTADRTDGGNIP